MQDKYANMQAIYYVNMQLIYHMATCKVKIRESLKSFFKTVLLCPRVKFLLQDTTNLCQHAR